MRIWLAVLTAAVSASTGSCVTSAGCVSNSGLRNPGNWSTGQNTQLWAGDPGTGKCGDHTLEEHRAVWAWAAVEVLRHSGLFSRGENMRKKGIPANHAGRTVIKY